MRYCLIRGDNDDFCEICKKALVQKLGFHLSIKCDDFAIDKIEYVCCINKQMYKYCILVIQ